MFEKLSILQLTPTLFLFVRRVLFLWGIVIFPPAAYLEGVVLIIDDIGVTSLFEGECISRCRRCVNSIHFYTRIGSINNMSRSLNRISRDLENLGTCLSYLFAMIPKSYKLDPIPNPYQPPIQST